MASHYLPFFISTVVYPLLANRNIFTSVNRGLNIVCLGSTIHQACETGDLDRMKELVSLVPDLKNKADERGWAPVHISAAFGYLDLLKWLSVSDVNLTQQTPTGYTAIHLAAMNGHVNCIMVCFLCEVVPLCTVSVNVVRYTKEISSSHYLDNILRVFPFI